MTKFQSKRSGLIQLMYQTALFFVKQAIPLFEIFETIYVMRMMHVVQCFLDFFSQCHCLSFCYIDF